MGKLFLLGSPEDFSLVAKEFDEMNLDIRCCLNHHDVLSFIRQEQNCSNQTVVVACCNSPKDFQMILHRKDLVEHDVAVVLCNHFENRRTVEEIVTALSSLSDIGELSLELVHKTFQSVENVRDVLRVCELQKEDKRQYFVPRNQRITTSSKYSSRKVFSRRILRRWKSVQNLSRFFLNPSSSSNNSLLEKNKPLRPSATSPC